MRHQSSVHATERSTLKCPYRESKGCLQTFPNRDQQRKHVQRTHERRLVCELCPDAVFQKKQQLRKHMSESHGEGYACGHCGKQFARRKHLTSHIARIRKSKKKTTSHIYFEHSMTMPAATNPEEQEEQEELEVMLSSSSSEEESKEAPMAEGDEWNIELFERPAKR